MKFFSSLAIATGLAAFGSAAAVDVAASEEVAASISTEKRSSPPDVSFSQQAKEAIDEYAKRGEGQSEKKESHSKSKSAAVHEEASSATKSSRSHPPDRSSQASGDREGRAGPSGRVFREGVCDPHDVEPPFEDICEDLWETLCNPDDEVEIDDEFCDWLGFTYDVDWNDDDDQEYELLYVRRGSASSSSSGDVDGREYGRGGDMGNMCDPESLKPRVEDICEDIWEALCNPDDKLRVDREFCTWIGFAAGVEWNGSWTSIDSESLDYNYYDLNDTDDYNERRARRNLRG